MRFGTENLTAQNQQKEICVRNRKKVTGRWPNNSWSVRSADFPLAFLLLCRFSCGSQYERSRPTSERDTSGSQVQK